MTGENRRAWEKRHQQQQQFMEKGREGIGIKPKIDSEIWNRPRETWA